MTLNWEGTRVAPMGQLVMFCMAVLKALVAGMPPVNTFMLPMVFRAGPMMIPEATPPAAPGVSPMDVGIVVPRLWAGIMEIKFFKEVVGGRAMGKRAVLGYGIGTGPAGVGVRQTSGNPKSMPAREQFANMVGSLWVPGSGFRG